MNYSHAAMRGLKRLILQMAKWVLILSFQSMFLIVLLSVQFANGSC